MVSEPFRCNKIDFTCISTDKIYKFLIGVLIIIIIINFVKWQGTQKAISLYKVVPSTKTNRNMLCAVKLRF